jgi:hypothetical protein
MKYLVIPLLLFFGTNTLAQTNSGSLAQKDEVIKYDYQSLEKPDKLLPFDRPFFLEVNNFPGNKKILYVKVFEVLYKKGLRNLQDADGRPSFEIAEKDYKSEKNKLTLHFPALRSERDFNINVITQFSPNNVKQALKVSKFIHLQKLTMDTAIRKKYAAKAKKEFGNLLDSANRIPFNDAENLITFNSTEPRFEADFYAGIKQFYPEILDTVPRPGVKQLLDFPNALNQGQVSSISRSVDDKSPLFGKVQSLQKIIDDRTFNAICAGQLTVEYKYPLQFKDSYDIESRLTNIDLSLDYFNSVLMVARDLESKSPPIFEGIAQQCKIILESLNTNKINLNKINEDMKKFISLISIEANWLVGGSTVSADLQTVSKRHFTLDFGLTNLNLADNAGKRINVQKLFLGVNIFAHAIDKNVNFKYIRSVTDMDSNFTHRLESRNDFWHNVSFTTGVTLGGFANKDFDNVYSNFAFTFGPSIRVLRYFRLGVGMSLVKRVNNNPLITDKSTIIGYAASISLDQDLLDAAKSVVSMIFK